MLIVSLILFKSIFAYNNATDIKGYSLVQMVWYSVSPSVINAFVWNNVAGEISRDIITGEFAMHLLRPYPFFRAKLAMVMSSRLIAQIMDFIPSMVIFSIILFPYDMGDIEDLCENVSIINKGTIVYDGSIERLHTLFENKKVIELKFSREVQPRETEGLNATLDDPFTARVEIASDKTDVREEISRLLEILPISDININGISIEEVIKQIYQQ